MVGFDAKSRGRDVRKVFGFIFAEIGFVLGGAMIGGAYSHVLWSVWFIIMAGCFTIAFLLFFPEILRSGKGNRVLSLWEQLTLEAQRKEKRARKERELRIMEEHTEALRRFMDKKDDTRE